MVSPELQKKIDRAISLLRLYDNPNEPIEVAYSGGKDSDVILQLVRESGINYRAIYKNTTIDPPHTIKHVKDMGVEIRNPKKTFFELMCERGFPIRIRRFCCAYLKEYKILDKVVIGVRRDESRNRAERYKEPTECLFYGSGKNKQHAEGVYPILDWTSQDVVDFLNDRGIKIHPLYYREDGTIDPTRRLGCLCCPVLSKNKRIAAFKEHPNMVKFYIRAGKVYFAAHPDSKVVTANDGDVYKFFVRSMFFSSNKEWEKHTNQLFVDEELDYKKFLEDYFKIKFDNK